MRARHYPVQVNGIFALKERNPEIVTLGMYIISPKGGRDALLSNVLPSSQMKIAALVFIAL